MRILTADTQVLVVDVQERLLPAMADSQGLLERTIKLLTGMDLFGVPFTVSEQYPKGLGPTVPELATLLAGHAVLPKLSFSCWEDAALNAALSASGRKTVVLVGIEAHVCVLQTALDLAAAGYQPVVVADAVASRHPTDKDLALERLRQEGILVTGLESLLFELCRSAENPGFKALSKLVK
jgi:nicotinamidase-related amidase